MSHKDDFATHCSCLPRPLSLWDNFHSFSPCIRTMYHQPISHALPKKSSPILLPFSIRFSKSFDVCHTKMILRHIAHVCRVPSLSLWDNFHSFSPCIRTMCQPTSHELPKTDRVLYCFHFQYIFQKSFDVSHKDDFATHCSCLPRSVSL